jgi:pimeloyl-ACP methyl ester carboxylesterase
MNQPTAKMLLPMMMSIFRILLLLSVAWMISVVWMWIRQDTYLFIPNHKDPLPEYEKYRWDRTVNGVRHQGWFVDKGAEKTVIYHGGNAEDLAYHCEYLFNGLEANSLLVNYRGYGQSEGKPGERVMVDDAIAIFDLFCEETGTPPSSIYLMGRSLGTGVAVQVAAARPDAAGVILVTPYESIAAIARFQYPWLPIKKLLRHPFRSIDYVPNIELPALFILADYDSVIPMESGKKLAEAWGGEKTVLTLPNGHNDLHEHPDYYPSINRFVKTDQTPQESSL